jgi:hypothetical protein
MNVRWRLAIVLNGRNCVFFLKEQKVGKTMAELGLAALIMLWPLQGLTMSSPQPAYAQDAPDQASRLRMERILKSAKDYCARLSRAALDFVCLEDIRERTRDRRMSYPAPAGPWSSFPSWKEDVVEHTYLYDYQFISKDGQNTEKRMLLEYDGIKRKSDDATLLTNSFYFENVLFGPVDLLAESRQILYHYHLQGWDVIGGERACVIDAVPTPSFSEKINQGRIWLREKDSSIMKIVWDMKSLKHFAVITETAKKYKSVPLITQVTEFELEKNGVRFPSRFVVEEAYVDKKGKRFVKSEINVAYRNYRFFTVELDTPIIK